MFQLISLHSRLFDILAFLLTALFVFTPLLHKDAVESTAYPHKKAISTLLPPAQRASWPGGRITSKGHSWIDPGDDIGLTAIPLWVRV